MATEGNGQPAAPSADDEAPSSPQPLSAADEEHRPPKVRWAAQIGRLIRAIQDSDEAAARDAVLRLSQSRRLFGPAAFAVGAVAMLFGGLKLLCSNWRLTLVELLPAIWIWAAMLDLKVHLLRGQSFHVLRGPVIIPIVAAIAAITAASFFLNAVFAFAIARRGPPQIKPALHEARSHLAVIAGWGVAVGVCLGVAAVIFTRWGLWWFTISLSAVIAVMMVCYVAVPARLIGIKTTHSRRDKLTAAVVGGAIGAMVCTPGYVLGRVGLVMLGSSTLLPLGIVVFTIGLALQAGTTSAVKAIQMSAKLISGRQGVRRQPIAHDAADAAGG